MLIFLLLFFKSIFLRMVWWLSSFLRLSFLFLFLLEILFGFLLFLLGWIIVDRVIFFFCGFLRMLRFLMFVLVFLLRVFMFLLFRLVFLMLLFFVFLMFCFSLMFWCIMVRIFMLWVICLCWVVGIWRWCICWWVVGILMRGCFGLLLFCLRWRRVCLCWGISMLGSRIVGRSGLWRRRRGCWRCWFVWRMGVRRFWWRGMRFLMGLLGFLVVVRCFVLRRVFEKGLLYIYEIFGCEKKKYGELIYGGGLWGVRYIIEI